MNIQPSLFPEITAIARRELKRGNTHRLYSDIRYEYKRLSSQRRHGEKIYTNEYIFAVLSRKFYKSPKTIENIVFFRV